MARPICGSIYEALNRNVGILSLTEVSDDVVMWAHYADSHRGFLIGFDERHPFFNRRRSEDDDFYSLRRVIYADLPPARSIRDVSGDAILVTKAARWSYEREWRMLAPLGDATRQIEADGEIVYLFPIPPEAIVSVVIGAHAGATLDNGIHRACRADTLLSQVDVSQAILDLDSQTVQIRGQRHHPKTA